MPSFTAEGIFPNDSINVRALMLWPDDEVGRQTYYAADYANGFVRHVAPDTRYEIRASDLCLLLDANGWTQINSEAARRTKRAVIAGMVFGFMFLMDHLKDRLPPRGAKGASLSKAFAMTGLWAKSGATYGDGSRMLASKKSIEDCWAEFRSVSHFWAAMQMNLICSFAPQKEIFNPPHFVKFMQAVSYLQMFGTTVPLLNNKGTKTLVPLLDQASTWTIDTKEHQPRIPLPANPADFDDAPFVAYLRTYRA